MIVRLHIDRLVLEGLPLGAHEGPQVQAAVEAELGRLIGDDGIAPQARTQVLVRTEPIAGLAPNGDALGTQIGAAVYRGLAP